MLGELGSSQTHHFLTTEPALGLPACLLRYSYQNLEIQSCCMKNPYKHPNSSQTPFVCVCMFPPIFIKWGHNWPKGTEEGNALTFSTGENL